MQNKVVWREGLFIRPQHFQQNDRYFNYELTTRTSKLRSNSWGLFDLEIDEHLLSTGKLVITSVSGILPDGTLFDVNTKNQDGITLDITREYSNKIIYLALPLYIQDSDDIHFEDQKNLLTRFKARTLANVPNTNAGESSKSDILISQYNFKLLLEDDTNDGFIKIAIGKIGAISTSGAVTLTNTFIPTYLHFNSSLKLKSKVNELLSMINFRIEKLSEKVSDSVLQATELGDYLMLLLLNKTESIFHFLLSQDKTHPDEIFLQLTSLAAELAVFMKKEKRLIHQFNYNHSEQGLCFEEVLSELRIMLSMVLEQNSIPLNIEKQKYGIYISAVKDKEIIKSSSFIFAVTADIPTQKIKEILINGLKIGTIETIKKLVNYHLVGFKIRPLSSPPKEIPFRANHLYFSLELTEENKDELSKSAGFAFHLSEEIPNVKYLLWGIKNA